MVMSAMGTSLQRTIDDRHPEAEARDEAMDRARRELHLRGALRCVRVSLAGQQIPCVLLPDAHQSRAARGPEELERKLFKLFYQSLRECSTIKTTVGMALAL